MYISSLSKDINLDHLAMKVSTPVDLLMQKLSNQLQGLLSTKNLRRTFRYLRNTSTFRKGDYPKDIIDFAKIGLKQETSSLTLLMFKYLPYSFM